MVIGNPSQGDETVEEDIWLKRQFTWNPDEFGGDIDATVEAWYEDTVNRFQDRTGFNFNQVTKVSGFRDFANMWSVLKAAMRYRIENLTKPLNGGRKNKINDSVYLGNGSQVFNELVTGHSEGLRPGEYRRPLISAADSGLKEEFIKKASRLINNEDSFQGIHPVSGLELDSDKYALRFNIPYPEGFIVPRFERLVETTTESAGTDLSTLPLDIVVQYVVLRAITSLDDPSKMNAGQVFKYLSNADGNLKQQVGPLAGPLMLELGYGRNAEVAPVPLDELEEQLNTLIVEYNIQEEGINTTTESRIEQDVPVIRFQIEDLKNPDNSITEFIRLEDFFYTHRNNELLQTQISRIIPPLPQLSPDLYPNIGGTSANGWRQIGGASGSYIIKFSRDPLDLLCISTGRAGFVPNQNNSEQNGIESYTYHLEVENDAGQQIVKEFSSKGWNSCQGLRCSATAGYGSGPYEGVAYGECVIYYYPDDPNGWDRSKPLGRLYLRWGFKDWANEASERSHSAKRTLKQVGRSLDDFKNISGMFQPGEANGPVILWEPRPYPYTPDIQETLKAFFNTAWEICAESYRSTRVGPSHNTFTIGSVPYRINGFSDVSGGSGFSTYGGSEIPRFSLSHTGADSDLQDLGGELPDYSDLKDPLISEEIAMARSSDLTQRSEAYEALANNATIWLYPAVIQNMRSYTSGMPALQIMSSSSFAISNWLRSIINSQGLRLDEHFHYPWNPNNLISTVTSNPQIFFDPVTGINFTNAEKMIGSPGMSFQMHGHRYIYRAAFLEDQPTEIQQMFANLGAEQTTIDIGSAFELFYLGLLHPFNNMSTSSSPSAPFITCLPAGDARIKTGSPELRNLPIGIEAVAEDFLSGSLMKRASKTQEARCELRHLVGYSNTRMRPEFNSLTELMIVWRSIITSPWLSQSMFDELLQWYSEFSNGSNLGSFIPDAYALQVLQLWQYPFDAPDSRGFKLSPDNNNVFQNVHTSWKQNGWPERQSAVFTEWAATLFPKNLGLLASNVETIEKYLTSPLLPTRNIADSVSFAPFMIRTQEAFESLYTYLFSLTDDYGAAIRFCLLFSPLSLSDETKPLLSGISQEDGGFLSVVQYQNLLTEALEDEGPVKDLIQNFQYDFLPRSTVKRFREKVPMEIQDQLLGSGAQVGYNLVSSFLRLPSRIAIYADQMMEIALGDLYPSYAISKKLPIPPEGNLRRFKRDNNMKLKTLVSAAIGGLNNVGGLCRNPNLPDEVAELVANTWFTLTESWNEYSYGRNLEAINMALAENEVTPERILKSIYKQNVSLQNTIAMNPNCPFEILLEIFGLVPTDTGDVWTDDASPLAALNNPGLSEEEYVILYSSVTAQLQRDARSMDASAFSIPTCFQVFDNSVTQFYASNSGASRTAQVTSLINNHSNLRYWRGGSDKGSFSGNISEGWGSRSWPGVDTTGEDGPMESCVRTWRLNTTQLFGIPSGISIDDSDNGIDRAGKLSEGLQMQENGFLDSPFVMFKYNTSRASGRGDGNQTTCNTYGDKPIIGNSTYGQVLFVQRLYKRLVGRGALKQNDDGNWVGRRFVWTFDGYWYDEEGNKHEGITYQAESLDEFFGWLGKERYTRIGFGEGRDGLKWAQGVVVCITDQMIINMAQAGLSPFDEFFGATPDTTLEPVPLWRANWSNQDSLNLMRSILNKPWALSVTESNLNIGTLRDELRASPLRIFRPGAEPGTEPELNVSTLMQALDQPSPRDVDDTIWTPRIVEYFAWDILQGGEESFMKYNNLTISFDTPSIFLPLLISPDILEAYESELPEFKDFAIRSNQGNPSNVLNIILNEFNVSVIDLNRNGVWANHFRGTKFGSRRTESKKIINRLLTNSKYRELIPIEFLTSIYTVQGVDEGYLGDAIISATGALRSNRVVEFQQAYARQRALIINLLSQYTRGGMEYALGQISVGGWDSEEENVEEPPIDFSCFSDEMFVMATATGRRFDGNPVRWAGYILNNRAAYVDRLMANRSSLVGMMTKQELEDLMISVNYNCQFAFKVVLPMYETLVDQAYESGYEPEEADARAVFIIRSQLDTLLGEVQADSYLDMLPTNITKEFSFLNDVLGTDDWLDLDDFIDDSETFGKIRTE